MTLHSMQSYLKDTVQGLQSPGWEPAIAYVDVPAPGNAEIARPMIFIWGAVATDSRLTISRAEAGIDPMLTPPGETVNSGWRQRAYTATMWMYGLQLANDEDREWKFPVFIEQVCHALQMTAMPTILTDDITGERSQLFNLGENFSWEYDVDRTLADQRNIRNECALSVQVLENYQF